MERTEDLQLNGLKILRRDDLPGYTTDSVLLADFVKTKPGLLICDLGTGTGIIPFLLIGRMISIKVTGIEINQELEELAARSAELNGLEHSMRTIHGDIRHIEELVPAQSFHAVVCNPPYFSGDQGRAHTHQLNCDEQDILKAVKHSLLPKGYFYTCCPADRLLIMADVMRQHGLEPKRVRFVASRVEKAPYLVLIEGRLGAKPGYIIEPQLIILDESNQYTDELNSIYHIHNEEKS